MSDEALKPCPFCGCAFPAVGYDGDAKTLGRKECITAMCRQCGGETRKFSSQAEAITAWNTRADDDRIEALQADKAKLREALAPFVNFWEWDLDKTGMRHSVSQFFAPDIFVRAVKTFHETGEHIPLQETER